MKTRDFIHQVDHARVVAAIREAERDTSGEIRIFVHRGDLKEDARAAAEKHFLKFGMQKTAERNGVLIFVAPRPQKFAVIGDEAVHQKCGDKFWGGLVEEMEKHFRENHFTDALIAAVTATGKLLTEYFPKAGGGPNELPDSVIEG